MFPQSAFSTPSGGSGARAGTYRVTGGGLKGVSAVQIRLFDVNEMGSTFCGGLVGKKKFCIRGVECAIATHQSKKIAADELPELSDGVGLFILDAAGTAALKEPHLGTNQIGSKLQTFLDLPPRPTNLWEEAFRAIKASKDSSDEDEKVRDQFLEHVMDEEAAQEFKTPFKKRRTVELSSPEMEKDLEGLFEEVAQAVNFGSTVQDSNWKLLVNNVEVLKELFLEYKETHKRHAELVQSELRKLDFNDSILGNSIGQKPAGLEGGTAFEIIAELKLDLGKLEVELQESQLSAEHTRILSNMTAFFTNFDFSDSGRNSLEGRLDVLVQGMQAYVSPLVALFSKLSSSEHSPGDKFTAVEHALGPYLSPVKNLLQEELSDLNQRLRSLEDRTGQQAGAGPASFGSFATGFGTGAGVAALDLNEQTGVGAVGELKRLFESQAQELKELRTKITDLEDQAQDKVVSVSNVHFKSHANTSSWITRFGLRPHWECCFIDAFGLLAIGFTALGTSVIESMSVEANAAKAGYSDRDQGALHHSFTQNLPAFFGKDSSNSRVSSGTRMLPAMLKYEAWKGIAGGEGAAYELQELVRTCKDSLLNTQRELLSGEALLVANEMLMESVEFLSLLRTWVSTTMTQFTDKGHQEDDSWILMSRAIRAIFRELSTARNCGRGMKQQGKGMSGSMWACLQGIKKQREFKACDFGAHAVVSHILHLHVHDNTVSKSSFTEYCEDTKLKLEKMAKDISAAGKRRQPGRGPQQE